MDPTTTIASSIFSGVMIIASGWYIIGMLRKGRLDRPIAAPTEE